MDAVLSDDPKLNKSFFMDEPGGTGKTYVINVNFRIIFLFGFFSVSFIWLDSAE